MGSSGRRSGFASALFAHALVAACEQWIAIPTKSVRACCGFVFASVASGEGLPNTCVMSPVAAVELFSSSRFAVPTPPTSHPSRVNGTHGAGVFFCPSVIMFGSGSFADPPAGGSTGLVQYLNELIPENFGVLLGPLKYS